MISIKTAHRIIELNNWVKALRADLKELDSAEIEGVTLQALYKGPKLNSSYYHSEVKREMKFIGDDARWAANLIRKRKQERLDGWLRELRQLDGEIIDG